MKESDDDWVLVIRIRFFLFQFFFLSPLRVVSLFVTRTKNTSILKLRGADFNPHMLTCIKNLFKKKMFLIFDGCGGLPRGADASPRSVKMLRSNKHPPAFVVIPPTRLNILAFLLWCFLAFLE